MLNLGKQPKLGYRALGRRVGNSLFHSPESRSRHLVSMALRYQEQSEKRSPAGFSKGSWNEEAPCKSLSDGHRVWKMGGQYLSKPFDFCPSFDPTIPLLGNYLEEKIL